MRPTIDGVEEWATAELRQAMPELEDRYDELVDIYEDDIGADVVFGALADLVNDIVLGAAYDDAVLARCLELVETVAELNHPEADEIVGFYFLDMLSPGALAGVSAALGE